jgi:hypothetical protein
MAFYYLHTHLVCRTNDDETSPTDEYADEVDLELGVCPFCILIMRREICNCTFCICNEKALSSQIACIILAFK